MTRLTPWIGLLALVVIVAVMYMGATRSSLPAAAPNDIVRQLQTSAIRKDKAEWGHWGVKPDEYTNWTTHSNRLVPVYTFGIQLDNYQGENSLYRDADRVRALYGRMPDSTIHPKADYLDQTDIYKLQQDAIAQGKRFVFLIVFDGMDWETTQAAATYRNRAVKYSEGRGSGLAFQDYDETVSDYGFFVCSPFNDSTSTDVNAQVITSSNERKFGGYNPLIGGFEPWDIPASYPYLIGRDRAVPHAYTDSAASATSMTSGIKTYNGSINVTPDGKHVIPIARELQQKGFAVGTVSSVPFCHATPASAYANNVTRRDYQDLARDLLGLPSIANRQALSGMDVVIGCGWGDVSKGEKDLKSGIEKQGTNFVEGNQYLVADDLQKIDVANGGKYQIALRTKGTSGAEVLKTATQNAVRNNHRLFGLFGTSDDHLPYATANGDFVPTKGNSKQEKYSPEDLSENPTLAEMTQAALEVLEKNKKGFWLLVEPGDVDWANHQNNIDDSIGAVFSGEAAFRSITRWIEDNDCWDESAVIVTADHGHLLVLEKPEALIPE